MVHMVLYISNCTQHYLSFVVNILNKNSQEEHQFLEHCNDMASPTQNNIALNVRLKVNTNWQRYIYKEVKGRLIFSAIIRNLFMYNWPTDHLDRCKRRRHRSVTVSKTRCMIWLWYCVCYCFETFYTYTIYIGTLYVKSLLLWNFLQLWITLRKVPAHRIEVWVNFEFTNWFFVQGICVQGKLRILYKTTFVRVLN